MEKTIHNLFIYFFLDIFVKKTMELDNEIKLPNRDGIGTKFVKVKDNVYRLEQHDNFPFSVTGTLDNVIAVDPPGGPYITVGYEINNYVVMDIKFNKGFEFTLAKNKQL